MISMGLISRLLVSGFSVWLCAIAASGQAPSSSVNPPPALPALAGCGVHGRLKILCGTHSPEDLELTPDGKRLIVSQFVNNGGAAGPGAGLTVYDPASVQTKNTFAKIPTTAEPLKDWGDSACPGAIGDALAPHGISLLKRNDGKIQLYVVNHGRRESIEMFEVKQTHGELTLVWHGCVLSPLQAATQGYNDVAALPDGGFVATHPTTLQTPGTDLFAGQPSGYVSRWVPGRGEIELPDTRRGYPNGVIVSADQRYAYFNAWTAREVHKYDLQESKEVGMVKLDFMPDNLTWAVGKGTKSGKILAAGIRSPRGECPAGSGTPCRQSSMVAEIMADSMNAKTVFDSADVGKPAPISGEIGRAHV
jgi:hypothetical protein